MFELIEGGASKDGAEIPEFLKSKLPAVSPLFTVDERVPIIPFVKALADAGYHVVNLRDGRLVVTQAPEDFRRPIP